MTDTDTAPTQQPILVHYALGENVTAFSTTRHGGYSTGNYSRFNVNAYCGDKEENIRRNRKMLCNMLGIGEEMLVMPHQVHGTRVVGIDKAFIALTASERKEALEGADAVMTDLKGVCVGVSTADCIPALLYDPVRGCACAVHAGWRGTVASIVEQAVSAMQHRYGSQPQDMRAQIGPGISLENFEVGDEVYEAFCNAGFERAPISRKQPVSEVATAQEQPDLGETTQKREKWHINLPECNRRQLLKMGVKAENIAVATVCTYSQWNDFYSARRMGIRSGRILTAIIMGDNKG